MKYLKLFENFDWDDEDEEEEEFIDMITVEDGVVFVKVDDLINYLKKFDVDINKEDIQVNNNGELKLIKFPTNNTTNLKKLERRIENDFYPKVWITNITETPSMFYIYFRYNNLKLI